MSARRAGLTLVELLVAMFLATLVIAAIAGTSIQVQETINTTSARELATQQARALFRDIENDLSRMIPCAQAPPPFDQDVRYAGFPQRPLELELVQGPTVLLPGEFAALTCPRRADRIRIFCSFDGQTAPQQEVVEYIFDQNGTAASWSSPPGGGYAVGRLRRKVWKCQPLDPGQTVPDPGPVLCDNVAAFFVNWLDAAADGPQGFLDPDAMTTVGAAFVRQGTFSVDQFTVTAADPAATALIAAIPVGGELRLTDPNIPNDPGTSVLVRHKFPAPTAVLVNERLDTKSGLTGTTFLPPTIVRVTLELTWGKGQKAETGRFVRAFQCPR